MTEFDFIHFLAILVLVGLFVALMLLIALLWRFNRLMTKIDHIQNGFQQMVTEIVPAIINFGTIATSVEAVVRKLIDLPRPKTVKSKKP